jgi:hypothetical protein
MVALLTVALVKASFSRYGPHYVLALSAIGAVVVVLALTTVQHRRWIHLFRVGEERVAKVITDRRALLWRELTVAIPEGEREVMLTMTLPKAVSQFEELDHEGRRIIRVLVDRTNLRRWHPIPAANV